MATMASCWVASQAVMSDSVVMWWLRLPSEIEDCRKNELHGMQHGPRCDLNEGRAMHLPIDALHLLYHHEPRGVSAGQPDARPVGPVGPGNGTGNEQARGEIEFPVGENEYRPILCLLPSCLRF